ncbi:diguanylate cyclase (GGDEF) domain-containing protein [Rivularia sp. PCC 7116]|uniref:two-component system response regulator n=1 Tax=Rivularia sp. PCC 7116 TaxID=373994 RepID=UPI00029F29B5|nr:EAL domain-containing protein [Rivularia sp. PCC 7116]AFY58122.1 diguanylate cyclase (GGDEF) domain-containing protein [Rivularia sp. PCC 7116]
MLDKPDDLVDEYKGVILVVDDTPNNLNVLFSYLRAAGFKVLVAQTGKNALKSAEYSKPDLILLDILMSGIDGFEICRQLKSNSVTKDIPVIFMTGLSDSINKVRGFELGAVDYVTKPIQKEELIARIQTHINMEKLRNSLVKQNAMLQQQAEQEKLLSQLSERIRDSLDVNFVIKTAAKEILQYLKCDRVLISRLDNLYSYIEQQVVQPGISEIPQDNIAHKYFIKDREEKALFLRGEIKAIDDIEASNLDSLSLNNLQHFQVKAALTIPILFKSDETDGVLAPRTFFLWGFLTVHQCSTTRQWKSEEIQFIQRLVNQLAIGIQQGRLCNQLSTANKELKQLALCDSLTKVYNRRFFDEKLIQEWNRLRRIPSPLSIIMCDVDCFKSYNDTYGHHAGDKCLRMIADAIANTAKRPADCVARYGGGAFVIILPYTPARGALKVAEAIRNKIKELNIPHTSSSVSSAVTVSMGIAGSIPNSDDNPVLLVEAADHALYLAKAQGRNREQIYIHDIAREKSRKNSQLLWVKKLRKALDENKFCLYTQPIVPLNKDNDKIHYEVLIRLIDDNGKVLFPEEFLEVANLYSMMPRIDLWVIDNLFNYLSNAKFSNWDNICFSINISGASLNDNQFLKYLYQKFLESSFPPHIFCFEITETIAINNLSQASKFIKSLKSLGCSFALDDFGKGMSSLTYLKNLPVDYLKIDGSFIREIHTEPVTKAMVQAINYLADAIGVKTIAEFAENQEIVNILQELKIDYAQGYFFGKPSLIDSTAFPILKAAC